MTDRVIPRTLKTEYLDQWFDDVLKDLKNQWKNADYCRKVHVAEWMLEAIELVEQDDFWGTEGFFRD